MEGETVHNFITSLYCLAEPCGYGPLNSQMIRDRIVVGLRDAALSEKVQLDPDLTLEKAVASACQRERVKKQQAVVRGDDESQCRHVRSKSWPKPSATHPSKPKASGEKPKRPPYHNYTPPPPPPHQNPKTCTLCGRLPPHGRQHCPAKDATYHKFSMKGHFQIMCRSTRTVGTVQA